MTSQLDFSVRNNEPHVRFSDIVFNTGLKKYYFSKIILYQQNQTVFTDMLDEMDHSTHIDNDNTLNDKLMLHFIKYIENGDLSETVFIRLIKKGLASNLAEVFVKWYFLLDDEKWNRTFRTYNPLHKNTEWDYNIEKKN